MDSSNSVQLANAVMMVRPAHFGYNPDTGRTNAFQSRPGIENEEEVAIKATEEFDRMVMTLRSAGIEVLVFEDDGQLVCPDAVFPNNWITTHADGTVITYPMESPSRRMERRDGIVSQLLSRYEVKRRFSLEIFEDKKQFLEGTGSMIFDHDHRLIYACLSPRTDIQVLSHLASLLRYEAVYFDSMDQNGVPVYHTNVMMALGADFVVVCLESTDQKAREMLQGCFRRTGKEIIEISLEQMNRFAGNMLQLRTREGRRVLVMSQTAYEALDAGQIARLRSLTDLLPVDVSTIETVGGGSVRCMMAELFLSPRKT